MENNPTGLRAQTQDQVGGGGGGWAASSQPTEVGHRAPPYNNNKYYLLTINEMPGFISLNPHDTYCSQFTEETELERLSNWAWGHEAQKW